MKEYWDQHARRDPLWAVLSDESKKDRGWTLDAFMATGEREISLLFHQLAELEIAVRRGRALDFGCGVGRLAQALARRFDAVVGLDISPRMIDIARRLNKYPDTVDYVVHDTPDLSRFSEPFDFIYSNVVLQHLPADLAAEYIRALCHALGPDGLLVFQLPSHPAGDGGVTRPMQESAYRATLELAEEPPSHVPPASPIAFRLRVRNASDTIWSQQDFGAMRAGNHWLSAAGEMLVQDDGRAALSPSLAPGEQQVIEVVVKTPSAAPYVLEFDLVHEGVTWFGDRGSPTLRVPVIVGEATTSATSDASAAVDVRYDDRALAEALEPLDSVDQPGEFPMNAIERAEVARIIADAGGRIERVEEDDHAKPQWVGYKYFVRKA